MKKKFEFRWNISYIGKYKYNRLWSPFLTFHKAIFTNSVITAFEKKNTLQLCTSICSCSTDLTSLVLILLSMVITLWFETYC